MHKRAEPTGFPPLTINLQSAMNKIITEITPLSEKDCF